MGDKITNLRNEIWDLKASRNPVLVAATEQWAADLQFEVDQLKGGRPPPAPRGLATPPKGGPKQGPSYMKDELLKLSRGLEAARLKTREAEKALHAELQKAPEEAQEVITSLSLGCRG
ncbi:hypothetical protein BHE74_00022595 [Ensete ventricosum]|nr:hypothetical protein BHE74_00022595 [Ensete ventricosum]